MFIFLINWVLTITHVVMTKNENDDVTIFINFFILESVSLPQVQQHKNKKEVLLIVPYQIMKQSKTCNKPNTKNTD